MASPANWAGPPHGDLYFAEMSGVRRLCMKAFGLAATVLVAGCMVAMAAAGGTIPAKLPADCSAYTSTPIPAEANKAPVPKAPPACASYRSYRGIGRPVNYSVARACAWQERLAKKADLGQNQEEPVAWVVGGSLILADMYFNGAGVKRNVPLAMRFACEFDEGMAKLALPDIEQLNISPHAQGTFEFCDYAETTFTMNFCSDYKSEMADDRRSRYYNSLKSSMSLEQQAAFEGLLAAQSAYIDAHAFEVDQGGTIRNIRTNGSQEILENLFHVEIVHFERRKWPPLSDSQIKTADSLLHREYETKVRQLRAQSKEAIDDGAVTADHLSMVEESWEKYRNAWVEFARLRYPTAVAVIRAKITLDRYRLLKTI